MTIGFLEKRWEKRLCLSEVRAQKKSWSEILHRRRVALAHGIRKNETVWRRKEAVFGRVCER